MVLEYNILVIYFGLQDYCPTLKPIKNEDQILQRIVFPSYKYVNDPSKAKRRGEQDICFIRVVCGEQNTLLLDVNNELWGFGSSSSGQLGRNQTQLDMPVNISQITRLQFDCISAGNGFIVAQSLQRRVFLWGHLKSYGIKYQDVSFDEYIEREYKIRAQEVTNYFYPPKMRASQRRDSAKLDEIRNIKCVGDKTYVLTQYKLQILGQPSWEYPQVVGLAINQLHCLAWDLQGRVWSWGDSKDGKLGYMNFEESTQPCPRQVEFDYKIIQCACGYNYSIALDVKGDFYAWGKGPFKKDLIRAIKPSKLIEKVHPFIKVVAGHSHFGALDLKGNLYVWGLNYKNCLLELEDEVKIPTKLDLKALKVLELDMGPFNTVLIVPANPAYKLPQPNLEYFTTHQHKRVQDAIRDFQYRLDSQIANNDGVTELRLDDSPRKIGFEKRNSQELNTLQSDVLNVSVKIEDLKSAKSSQYIARGKSFKSNKKYQTEEPESNHIQIFKQALHLSTHQPLDKEMKVLEKQQKMFPAILDHLKQKQPQIEEVSPQELDELINTENDELKYQYIEMVKDQDEDQVFMNLLQDTKQIEYRSQQQLSYKMPKIKNVKVPKIKTSFELMDERALNEIKVRVLTTQKLRTQMEEKKRKKQEEMLKDALDQQKFSRVKLKTKDEIIDKIQKQSYERDIKLQYVQQKRDEFLRQKMSVLLQQQYEKSQEYRDKRRLETIKHQQNLQALKTLLTYLNMECFMQMLQGTCQKGLEQKRMTFKEHMKARIIQNTIRKRNVIKKIKGFLNERQKKLILGFMFKLRLHLRIQKKFLHIRKINLFYQRQQLVIKVRSALYQVDKAARTIQESCLIYNRNNLIQLSYLNIKWDQFLLQQYKGTVVDKEREELRANTSGNIDTRAADLILELTQPLVTQSQLFTEFKVKKRALFKSHELRQSILKKIKFPNPPDDEFKDVKQNQLSQVLLPYTRFHEAIALPVQMRIRFDYQQIEQLEIKDKVDYEEIRLKHEMLKQFLIELRKGYVLQVRQFFQNLLTFKKNKEQALATERMKLMMKLSHDELKLLRSRDDLEALKIQQKKDLCRKRRNYQPVVKQNIFALIREMPNDRYPCPGLSIKILESMYTEAKPKFRAKISLDQWKKMISTYHQQFKTRFHNIMANARLHAAQKQKGKDKKKAQTSVIMSR